MPVAELLWNLLLRKMFELSHSKICRLRHALARLRQPNQRVVSLFFFNENEVALLRQIALQQEFRSAQAEINYKGRVVFQDFDVCFPAPRTGVFDQVATQLEIGLFKASVSLPNPPLPEPLNLADFAIQRYPVGARGIGIHRDGIRYRQIVVIITLDGASRLFTCSDRRGKSKRRIDDRPGRLVLLSAEGFAGRFGEDARPLHGVDRVNGGRLSLGFRTVSQPN